MDISKASNLNEVFLNNFEEFSEKIAMKFRNEGGEVSLTYRQLKAKVLRVVNYLVHVGLVPEDRTVIWAETRPEWIWADMGILMAGGVNSAIPVEATTPEVVHVVNDLRAKFLFVDNQAQLDLIKTVKSQMPSLELVFVFGEVPYPVDWVVPFSWLFEFSTKAVGMGVLYKMEEENTRDSLLTVVYPSQNIAGQRGIKHTHGAGLEMVEAMEAYFGSCLDGVGHNLSFLSPAHPFARFLDYYLILMTGRCMVFAEKEVEVIQQIKKVKPQVVFAEPAFIESLYKKKEEAFDSASFMKRAMYKWAVKKGGQASEYVLNDQQVPGLLKVAHNMANVLVYKNIKKEFGGSLRFLVSGGMPLKAEVVQFFHALGVTVLDSFGSPETAFAATANLPSQMRIGSAGKPLPKVSVRVSNYNEIEVKGPSLFTGYYNRPRETAAAFTPDGFYRTGMVGRIDEQGFLFVTGSVN